MQKSNSFNKSNNSYNLNTGGSSLNNSKQIKIGNYILGKTIGKGNSAVVKIATHAIIKQKVAIKMFDKSVLDSDKQIRLMREIDSMKRLKHPNIIRIYEIMETAKIICIVTEIASNGELYDFITQKKRLSEREARHIFKQIVTGVHHCHKNNVVHRDIKVENILLDNNGRVKLADFGFSTFFKHGELMDTWCGSPQYCAPELYLAKLYEGPNVDIWSLGVVLYVLVCGYLPFEAQIFTALRAQVIDGSYKTPFFLSPECKNLIDRMLTFDSNKRIKMSEIINHKWMNYFDNESNLNGILDSGMSDNSNLSFHNQANFQEFKNLVDKVEQISINEFIPDEAVLYEISKYELNIEEIINSVRYNKFDSNAAIYYLIEYRLANTTPTDIVLSQKQHNCFKTNKFEATKFLNNKNNNRYFDSLNENSSYNGLSNYDQNGSALYSIDVEDVSKLNSLNSIHENALESANHLSKTREDIMEKISQVENNSDGQQKTQEDEENKEDLEDEEDMLIEQQGRDYLCRNKTRRHTIGTNVDKAPEADIVKSTECLLMLDETEEYEQNQIKTNFSNDSPSVKNFDQDNNNKRLILKKRQPSTSFNQQASFHKTLTKPSSRANKLNLLSSQFNAHQFSANEKNLLVTPASVNRRASDGGSNILLFNQIYALKNTGSSNMTTNNNKYSEINEHNTCPTMNFHNNNNGQVKYFSRGSITSGMPIFPSSSQLSPSTTSSDSQNLNSSDEDEVYSNNAFRCQRKNSRSSRHEPYNLDGVGNSLLTASNFNSSSKRKSFSGSANVPLLQGQSDSYNFKKFQDPLDLIYSNRAHLEGIYNKSIGAISPAKELQFLQDSLTIDEQAKLKYSKKSRKSILGQLNCELEAIQPVFLNSGNSDVYDADLYELQVTDQQPQNGSTVSNSENLNSADISNLFNSSNSKSPNQMLHIIREEQNELNLCNGNNNNNAIINNSNNPIERNFFDSNEMNISNMLVTLSTAKC